MHCKHRRVKVMNEKLKDKINALDREIGKKLEKKYPQHGMDKLFQIQLGLYAGVDVSKYEHLDKPGKMLEIRLGLEKGLDVDKYKDLDCMAKMEQIRIGLELEKRLKLLGSINDNLNNNEG